MKPTLLKYTIIWLTLLSCIIASCTKKTKSTAIDADVKKYFSFKKGTYWIYKDSVSGQMDSFAVENNNTVSYPGNSYNSAFDDETDYYWVYANGVINDTISGYWSLAQNGVSLYYAENSDYFSGPLFVYPFTAGYTFEYRYIISNVYPTFHLNGNTYNTVAEIGQTGPFADSTGTHTYNDLFYVSTDAGIIKMKFNHGTMQRNWELVRYHIVH
jgi:hypothetical protein